MFFPQSFVGLDSRAHTEHIGKERRVAVGKAGKGFSRNSQATALQGCRLRRWSSRLGL